MCTRSSWPSPAPTAARRNLPHRQWRRWLYHDERRSIESGNLSARVKNTHVKFRRRRPSWERREEGQWPPTAAPPSPPATTVITTSTTRSAAGLQMLRDCWRGGAGCRRWPPLNRGTSWPCVSGSYAIVGAEGQAAVTGPHRTERGAGRAPLDLVWPPSLTMGAYRERERERERAREELTARCRAAGGAEAPSPELTWEMRQEGRWC
jgi:hypothetical protein